MTIVGNHFNFFDFILDFIYINFLYLTIFLDITRSHQGLLETVIHRLFPGENITL